MWKERTMIGQFVVVTRVQANTPVLREWDNVHVYGMYTSRQRASAAIKRAVKKDPHMYENVEFSVHKILKGPR
jgi:hypothetical protein